MPIAFAAFRLITSSYLVGACRPCDVGPFLLGPFSCRPVIFFGKHAAYGFLSKPLACAALLPTQKQLKLRFQLFVALFGNGAWKCHCDRPLFEVEYLLQHIDVPTNSVATVGDAA
jgi:hypothetical protein